MSAAAARAASGGRDVEGEPRAPATAPQPPAHRALAPPGDAAALPAAGKAARACGVGLGGGGGGGGVGSLVVVSGVARCPVKTAPPRPEQQQLLLQQQQQRPAAAATAATAAQLGPAKALSDSSSAPPFIAESAANSSSSNNNSGGGGLGIVVGGATVTAAPAVAAEGGQGRTRGRKTRRKKSGGRAKSGGSRSGRGRGGDDGGDGDGGGGGSQVDHVKQLLLLHLDMMEEQQHQLQSKEKEIQALKTEKEALLSRLERMERRMLLARRDGEKNDQQIRRDRKEQLKERNEENDGLEGSPPEQPPRSPLSPQKATDQHGHKRAQSPGEHDPGPTAKKLAMESENESSQSEALTRTPSKPAKGRTYHGKNGRKFSRRKGWARCKALTALNSAAETTNADSLSAVCRLKNKTDKKEDSSPVRESPEPCETPEIVRPWERSKGVNRKKNSCVKSALPATPELTETDIGSPRTPWHKNKKKVNSNHLSHSPAELSSKNSKAKGGNRAALELDTPRPSQWSKGKKGSNSANHSPSSPAETSTPQSSRTKGGKASLPVCPKRSGWSKGGRARGKWRQAHASPAPGGSCSPLRACTADDGRDEEEDPVLRTSEMYWCYQFQPPAVSMDEPILTEKDDTVAIPSWREIKLEPLDKIQSEYLLENTEDEAFNKRHTKHELDEKRRKRWDIQRIREQRQLQRLRERAFRKEGIPEPEPEMLSFFPEPEDVEELEVTPLLPVIAFGRALPRLLPQDFELPWLDDRTRQRLETPKKTSHGRGRCR
uniref:Male-specific lethal 1 homolog n=1 Tax=Petromyzon marinus TaxID=7757 RepID=A0AAJ7SZH2_PETMA|nr:male-specific lethal 1 homolog [Petromyzon marinus]